MLTPTVLKTMRPPFLLLVASCLSLPLCYSIAHHQSWSYPILLLIVVSALLAHISVNMLNEYMDCTSKLDQHTQRTPFSGGSGALVAKPGERKRVKYTALAMVALTLLTGLALLMLQNQNAVLLGVLGVAGIAIVISYTPWLNRSPWLCLVAPGIGFGMIMSFGSYVALTGQADPAMFTLSLIPLLLVNNLLLLNQFPDARVDERHGRRHLVIACGYATSAKVLMAQWVLVALLIVGLIASGVLPLWGLWTLLLLSPVGGLYTQARDYQATTPGFIRAMGLNVAVTLLLPVALALTLLARA